MARVKRSAKTTTMAEEAKMTKKGKLTGAAKKCTLATADKMARKAPKCKESIYGQSGTSCQSHQTGQKGLIC